MAKGRGEKSAKQSNADWPREVLYWLVVVVLLAVQAVLGVSAARTLSVTHDEYWHLPVGLLNLQQRRFDYDVKNPPLTRVWSAIPLALAGAKSGAVERTTNDELYGRAFLDANRGRYSSLYVMGRAMNLVWLFATGIILALWTRELFGRGTSLATVLLWASCPNVLAHGALVTPDAGLVCSTTATFWAVWRYAHQGTWPWAVGSGLLLGLALATKFTAVLLVPLIPCLWVIVRLKNAIPPLTTRTFFQQWGGAGLIALFVLNGAYLFEGTGTRLGTYKFSCRALTPLNRAPGWLKVLPLPCPKAYLEGLDTQRRIMEQKHAVYLDGQWREEGFRFYYLYALAYKLPHAVQLLLLLTIFNLLRSKEPRPWRSVLYVLLPVAALLIISSLSAMQLGVRYILPVFPLALMLAGMSVASIDWKARRWTSVLTVIALALLPLSLRGHPQHLGYFNEYAGGWRGGREHLLDSNLDWGQNLLELRDHVARNRITKLRMAYFGTLPPGAVGLEFGPPPTRPQPGTYAVSVSFVKGCPRSVRLPDGGTVFNEFGYFQFFEPKTTVGCSIDVYELTREDVLRFNQAARK